MYYTEAESAALEQISRGLMDQGHFGHAERLIINNVINDCKAKGESLEQRLQNFINEGLTAPH
jgi:hypothetical protein